MTSGYRGRRIKRALAAVLGLAAVAGIALLAIGFLLPGRWQAERSRRLAAPPERVFAHLDSLALWDEWTVWGDMPTQASGPGTGVGASRSWDDPGYGSGRFTITESDPPGHLAYRVEVEDGSIVVVGRFSLTADRGGTLITWREEGDFGRNPLLGFVARSMGESQGAELDRSLERLRRIVERQR